MNVENIKLENTSGLEADVDIKYNAGTRTILFELIKVYIKEVSNGKLTGVQLRAIAAKDQMDTLLEDRLYHAVKALAEADQEALNFLLRIASDPQCCEFNAEPNPAAGEIPGEDILKAIQAMALFCYMEITERGLKKPGLEG